MDYIPRAMEKVLKRAAATYKTVLVTGPRQVGKSTLLKNLFPGYKYVSLDSLFLELQARNDGGNFIMLNPPPAIIDEIQRAPELFRQIKIQCDATEDRGLFLLSGSQRFELMKNVSESLSGRIAIVELPGLSLREIQRDGFDLPFVPTSEYLLARQMTARPCKNIWETIHRGSFPELQQKEQDWASYYANYIKTYIERDVRELSAVHDLNAFQRFLISVAARTGEVLNCASVAGEIEKDAVTVRNWISILEASGMIFLLEPFANNAIKRITKMPKLYFHDTGLVCYLTRWLNPEALSYGAMSGHIFETYVISEIVKSYANAGLDYRHFISFFRTQSRKSHVVAGEKMVTDGEIDLIIERNGILHPVEIKQGGMVKADATAMFKTLDKAEGKERGTGAVVCNAEQPGFLRENVLVLPVWYI